MTVFISACLFVGCSGTLVALDYPGTAPGKANHSVADHRSVLENAVIRGEWKLDSQQIASLTLENRHTGQTVTIASGHLPRVMLDGGRMIDLASLRPEEPVHLDMDAIVATFKDDEAGLTMRWSATLGDGANAIIQTLRLTASRDTGIKELVLATGKAEIRRGWRAAKSR